jgi:hypothetical protein
MSKKIKAAQLHRPSTLDRFAVWLGQQSRLTRSFLAGLVALSVTGAIALVIYSVLMGLSAGNYTMYVLSRVDILTVLLVVFFIIGLALYWVGWRVLIGFDLGETALQPGRPAALWVAFGLIVLVVTVITTALVTLSALQQ